MVEEIGCCGAYCGTCREYQKTCKGCKSGYLDGSRDLSRAKCRMKKCCLTRGHITCGDCGEYESCETIQSFLSHPGYKYGKYRQALEYMEGTDDTAYRPGGGSFGTLCGGNPCMSLCCLWALCNGGGYWFCC